MTANYWEVLGIEPTRDRGAIKRAYAKQSQTCHPEENPEAFQLLQEAYQQALAWLRSDDARFSNSWQPLVSDEDWVELPAQSSAEAFSESGKASVFTAQSAKEQEEKDEFLRKMAERLPMSVTVDRLKPYLERVLVLDYLRDPLFKDGLEELLLSRQLVDEQEGGYLYDLALSYQLERLERVYRSKRLLAAPQKTQQNEPKGSKRVITFSALLLFVMIRLIVVSAKFSQIPGSPSPVAMSSTVSSSSAASSEPSTLRKFLAKPQLHTDETGYYLIDPFTSEKIPLEKVSQALVVRVDGVRYQRQRVLATLNGRVWMVLNAFGEFEGLLMLDEPMTLTSETVLKEQGTGFAFKEIVSEDVAP